ncbi:hypothetical protein B0H15DRAFT_803785 [Mycena belliarum]|uniref:Uncharacterized protein n=1 Tax=Mycena belliarum TaxID=1033014 RepID=A0AAD6TVK4_9AGAR|nr:hypothetical protein B0H15DRAFT_803785 [Mycena belliae]
MLLALLIACVVRHVVGQANRTVDDFSPLISYSPASAVTHLDTTGFEVPKLYNGTVAVMNASTVAQVNMTLKFTGTAIWLFLAKPATSDTFATSYNIFLDGVEVDEEVSVDQNEDADYGDGELGFFKDKLPLGPHSIQLMASDGGTVFFDYARFTSNDPTLETTIPPVSAPSTASTSSPGKAKTTTTLPASQSSAASTPKSTSHLAIIAGAAAAAILLLICALCLWFTLRHRRRPLATSTQQYASGNVLRTPALNAAQQGPYGDMVPQTSEAALLRAPTAASHYSLAAPSPPATTPLPVPQTYGQDQQETQRYPYPHQTYNQAIQHDRGPPVQHAPSAILSPIQGQHHPPHRQTQPRAHLDFTTSPSQSQSPSHAQEDYAAEVDADMMRMMADQRAVEEEYGRPTAWVVDEKGRLESRLNAASPGEVSPRMHAVSPRTYAVSPRTLTWVPVSSGTPASSSVVRPPTPGDAGLSSIAAEMRALRAQVARLEGGQHGYPQGMPPAYD